MLLVYGGGSIPVGPALQLVSLFFLLEECVGNGGGCGGISRSSRSSRSGRSSSGIV